MTNANKNKVIAGIVTAVVHAISWVLKWNLTQKRLFSALMRL